MKRRRRTPTPDLLDTLPPLSDEAAVARTDFFAELLYRLDARFFGQVMRYRNQQRDDQMPRRQTSIAEQTDLPF